MTQLIMQDCGTYVCLFVKGDTQEETEERYNSLYNFGATNSQPSRWTDLFGHIWTTRGKLMKYFETATLFELLGDVEACTTFKGIRGGLMCVARQIAAEKWEKLYANRETILQFVGLNELYKMGEISAEKDEHVKSPVLDWTVYQKG